MIKIHFPKRKNKFKKNNILPNPNIFWMIIFYLGFILTVFAFAFGLYLFLKINKENISLPPSEDQRLSKISKTRVDKILEIFEQRKKASSAIINSRAPVVDPSL